MMRTLAVVSAIAAAAVSTLISTGAMALGLGDVEVRSRLNERFSASIPLIAASPEDLESLIVEVAAPEEFARRGIDRSDLVNALRFERVGNGIRVLSPQAVRDPFLNFIVEARWNGGRLLREYTVLLDPPASAPSPADASTAVAAPGPTPLPLPGATAAAADTRSSYGPVQPAQTLWSIAKTLKRDPSVSMDQMLLALYSANPKAFVGGNINQLLSGIRLVVPSAAEALVTDAETARARVLELRAAGVPARPASTVADAAPAPAVAPSPAPVPAPAPAPAAPPVVAAPAPAPVVEVPPVPAAAVVSSTEPAPGTPIVESSELATAPEAAPPAEAAPAPAPVVEPPAPVAPPAVEAPAAAPVAEEPALPWTLIGGLLLLIVALIAVRLKRKDTPDKSRRSASSRDTLPPGPDPLLDRPPSSRRMPAEDAADEAPTVVAKPVLRAPEPEPEGDDETVLAPLAPLTAVGAAGAATLGLSVDASDPLTEADFHLAYGLYDEAAQMLKNAIAADPERVELKVKLAETWSAAGNARDFQSLAESMAGKVSPGEWQKISTMGRALLPDLALFGGTPRPEEAAPVAAPTPADALRDLSVIDFDLDAGLNRLDASGEPTVDPAPAPQVAMPDPVVESLLRPIDEPLAFDLAPPLPAPAPSPEPIPAMVAAPAAEPIALPPLSISIPQPEPAPVASPVMSKVDLLADIDLSSFDLDDESTGVRVDPGHVEFTLSDLEIAAEEPMAEPEPESDVIGGDEIDTKLDLARAYADMGDLDAARSLLAEVVAGGTDKQQQEARALSLRLQG